MSKPADDIRQLNGDYFHGLIDRASYRFERGRILDELVGLASQEPAEDTTVRMGARASPESAELESAEPDPPAVLTEPEPPVDTVATNSRRVDGPLGERANRTLVAGVGIAVVVALLIVMLLSDPETENVPGGVVPVSTGESPAVAATGLPGSPFIYEFMRSPRFEDEKVESFLFDWDELTLADQALVQDSEEFRRFASELRNRARVDRALSGSASSQAEYLARELGLQMEGVESRPDDGEFDDGASLESGEETLSATAAALQKLSREENQAAVDKSSDTNPSEAVAVEVGQPAQQGMTDVEEEQELPESESVAVATMPAPDTASLRASTSGKTLSGQACSADRLNTRSATCWDMLAKDVRGPVLRVVPAGEFLMGDARDPSASPVHQQSIERPFAIGVYEVTVSEFEYYCRESNTLCPERRWSGNTYPVVDVSWQGAVAFTNWLTEKTGARYRLPTEAEWEYAARAGTDSAFPFGDDLSPTDARFDAAAGRIAPLPTDDKTTRKNQFRLWHIVGNVREWTSEVWRSSYTSDDKDANIRVVRGGSYADDASALRSAARDSARVDYFDARTGFRVMRELEQ